MKTTLLRLTMLSSLALSGCAKREIDSAEVRASITIAKEARAKEFGLTVSAPDLAAQPFTISLPTDFVATDTITEGAKKVFHYARPTSEPGLKAEFQVIVAPLPTKPDSLEKMLTELLQLRRADGSSGFKATEYVKGTLGSAESLAVDYKRTRKGSAAKGRIIFAVSDGRLFWIEFKDSATDWTKSIPVIEKALQTFAFSK